MHATVDIPSGPRVVLSGDPVRSVADYLARGGGQGLRSARSLGPWRTAEEVTLSGLRVTDQNRCHLPVELQTVVASIMRAFPEDFVTHLEGTPTPSRPYRLPKIVDMAHGTVTDDAGTALEQPDWTDVDVRRAG